MGLQKTIVLARGGTPREPARRLIEALPASLVERCWSSVALFEPSGDALEIDLLVLGHHALYLVEPVASRGRITVNGSAWMVASPGMPDHSAQLIPSPVGVAREKAQLLAQFLKQQLGEARVWVEPLVVVTDPSADLSALPEEQRSRVLTPADFGRIVQFGEVPGKSPAAGETPVDEATVAAVRGILEGVQGRPRPGKGNLLDELPLLVRDVALDLRERAPQPDIQAAVLILACSFVRALEERGLLDRNLLAGEGAEEAERAFFTDDPALAPNALLSHVLASVAAHPAGRAVLEDGHERLWSAPRSNAASRAVLDFFRHRGPTGKRRWSFAADPWSDLYQEIAPTQRKEHGMLTTPTFVEKTMLDLTLTPALEEFGSHAVRVMDPACGSGLVLVMAFERLHERMLQASPGVDREASARLALDRIHGADISPISVLVTRIQLTLAYLRRAGITRFADAPDLPLHIVAADSLLAEPDVGASAGLEPLTTHGYEVVVCEPPFVTCKDATRREQYRARYRSAGPAFSLAAPFIERCFQLASEGGFVGLFVSSGFMKRAFGKALIEEVLPSVDLTRILDTSTAYIPGHGTPTLLLFGRRRGPRSNVVRVLVGKRGESISPRDPATGEVWSAIRAHLDEPGYEDDYIAVRDLTRRELARHPWTLTTGPSRTVERALMQSSIDPLRAIVAAIRWGAASGHDDAFLLPADLPRRLGLEPEIVRPHLSAASIQDWMARPEGAAIVPYDPEGRKALAPAPDARWTRYLWRYRSVLAHRQTADGRHLEPWWAWSRWRAETSRGTPRLLCRHIARMNDFVLDRGEAVIGQSVRAIELSPAASEADHLALLGYLNSSVVCFWLKQSSVQKGTADDAGGAGDGLFAFGDQLAAIPIPRAMIEAGTLRTELIELARHVDDAARERANCSPNSVLAGWDRGSRDGLIEALGAAQLGELASLRRMVCAQEDLDWLIYEMLGLIESALPRVPGSALPEQRPFVWRSDEPPRGLDRRLIEPWKRRKQALRSSAVLKILEDAAYKRRFPQLSVSRAGVFVVEEDETSTAVRPTRGELSRGQNFRQRTVEACDEWLRDRLEDVFSSLDAPRALEAEELVSRFASTKGVREVMSLRGGPDDPATLVRSLVDADAVPYLAAFRHTEEGIAKREIWEHTWEIQRREDASGNGHLGYLGHPAGYEAKDYRDAVTWLHRGELDVPTERFIRYPRAAADGIAARFGWTGWDHGQRTAILETLIREQCSEDERELARVVPFLAGILELAAERSDATALEHLGLGAHLQRFRVSIEELRAFRPSEKKKKTPEGRQP